jgi:hypothetical protein
MIEAANAFSVNVFLSVLFSIENPEGLIRRGRSYFWFQLQLVIVPSSEDL